jgi:hypothetical protein
MSFVRNGWPVEKVFIKMHASYNLKIECLNVVCRELRLEAMFFQQYIRKFPNPCLFWFARSRLNFLKSPCPLYSHISHFPHPLSSSPSLSYHTSYYFYSFAQSDWGFPRADDLCPSRGSVLRCYFFLFCPCAGFTSCKDAKRKEDKI